MGVVHVVMVIVSANIYSFLILLPSDYFMIILLSFNFLFGISLIPDSAAVLLRFEMRSLVTANPLVYFLLSSISFMKCIHSIVNYTQHKTQT